jgi:hypothetical protein
LGISREDPEPSSLLDVGPPTPHDHKLALAEIESQDEESDSVEVMRPIEEGTVPNEEALEYITIRQAEDEAAARRTEEDHRREEADVEAEGLVAEKLKKEIAWKEKKTRKIAVEARERLQTKLQTALKAARKYEAMVKAGTTNSKKGPKAKKAADKRPQIEAELKEIDRLLSMINH